MNIADYGFAIWETFYVTLLSTAFSLVIGLPLGVLLFIPQALRFLLPSSGTISIVINAVSFVVPAYYLLSAYLNYRDD